MTKNEAGQAHGVSNKRRAAEAVGRTETEALQAAGCSVQGSL